MSRITIRSVAVLGCVLVGVLTSCGSESDPQSSQQVSPPVQVAPPSVSTVELEGLSFTQSYFDCAQKLWDTRVDSWNLLSETDRDSWASSEQYFKSNKWPASFKDTLLAPVVQKECSHG